MSDANGYDAKGEVEAVRRELANLEGHQARRDQAVAQLFGVCVETRDRIAVALVRLSNVELGIKTVESKVDEMLGLMRLLKDRTR